MARFYKGAGVGTYGHVNDLRLSGLVPRNPGGSAAAQDIVFHIARATTYSPFISLSRSFGVARDYALNASRARPTAARPAYVYEIDLDPTVSGIVMSDPILVIAGVHANVFATSSYQHDGTQNFLLGVVDPVAMGGHLRAPVPQPRAAAGGVVRPANLSMDLEAMVRALRDAEVVVQGNIPRACVTKRFDEY